MHNMSNFWFANNKFNLLIWNKKHFPWFFKGFQLPEIVSWKEDCCVIPQKRTAVSWDIVTQAWNFQLLLNAKSSKLSLRNFLKTSKLLILVLKKRGSFFQILLHVCFMLWKFVLKNDGYFIIFFDKGLVKTNINKKSEKTK